MNRSASFVSFSRIVIPVYLAALVVAALAAPTVQDYISSRAVHYAQSAATARETSAQIGYYRLALALNPGSTSYRNRLADLYIEQNDPQAAINVLKDTEGERLRKASLLLSLGHYQPALQAINGLDGPEAAVVRSQAALEQGRDQTAYQAVLDARNDAERLQLGLSYAVAVNTDAARRVIPLIKDAALRQRLVRASGGGVALAQELYRNKLYQTSKRVLAKAGESSEKYLLLAHVQLERPLEAGETGKHKLEAAREAALQGTVANPASLKLHELLLDIYGQLEDQSGVTREKSVIQQLRSGKL